MRMLDIYNDLYTKGKLTSPRGLKVLEIQDYMVTLPPRDRFTSFEARNFNLDYAKFEMLWYLTADPYNDMIMKSASMWEGLRQPNGGWFSNYGYYWFGGAKPGFHWVINMLSNDPDSRQAVIPMLNTNHLFTTNKDIVCTYSVSFRIRDNQLFMSSNMRSQDAMWGFTNDIFCFSVLHEMVYAFLKETYPDLTMGSLTHKVDSFHVYERHFKMLEDIVDQGNDGYYEVKCPQIYDRAEVVNLLSYEYDDHNEEHHQFTRWLNDNRYSREN